MTLIIQKSHVSLKDPVQVRPKRQPLIARTVASLLWREARSIFKLRKPAPNPFDRVPVELLCNILSLVLAQVYYDWRYFPTIRKLRLVCSRWLEVIDGTPSLWARTCCLDSPREVDIALGKCHHCGPMLHVICLCGTRRTDYCSYLLNMRPYARLWRELLVKASNPDTIFSIFERFSLPDSNLRDVSIMFTPLDSASDIPIIPSSALYKLHELTISSCGLSWRPGDGTPNELRRLTLRDTALLTVDMLLQMLSMTTQLAELVIRHSRLGPSARNVQAGSVVLPNLQEFRLDHVTTEGATQLFLAIQYFEPTVKVVEFITAYEKDLAPPVVQRFTQHFHYAVSQVPNPSLSLRIGKGSLSFACGGFSLCFGESGGEWSRFGAVGKWETFEDLMERHFGPVFKTSTGPGLIIDGPPHGTTVEARSRLMMTCAMSLPHARSLHLVATDGELEAWLLGLAADYPVLERTRAAEVKKTFRAFPNLTALRLDERPGGHKKSVRGGIPMLNHFEETLAGLVRQRRSEPDVQEIKRLIIVEEMVIEDDYNTLPRLLSSLGFS